MIEKRLAKQLFLGTFLVSFAVPMMAFAAETTAAGAEDGVAVAGKALAAALAMGISAVGAGYAQAKIGSAGQGTLAERPEERIWVITLTALPEVIVLLGFVMAILLGGA